MASDSVPVNTVDVLTALKSLESMIISDNLKMHTFEKLPQILINSPVQNKKDLLQEPYCSIIKNNENKLKNGRVIVRYSGTENLLRVMAEDYDYNDTKLIAENLTKELVAALN